jgi:Na+/melibiose symporter-like transporter
LLKLLGAPTLTGRGPLVWAIAVDNLGGGLLMPFYVVFLIHVAGVPAHQIGIAYAVAAILSLPAGPLAGRLVDAVGPAPVLVVANLIRAGSLLALLAIDDVLGLIIVTVVSHYAGDAFFTSGGALIGSVVEPAEQRRWFAFQNSVTNIGLGAGALTTALILSLTERHAAYVAFVVVNATTQVLAAVVLWKWHHSREPWQRPPRDDPAEKTTSRWLRAALADRIFRSLLVTNLVVAIGAMAPGLLWTYYAIDVLHAPAWLPGLTFGVNTAIVAALPLPVNRVVESIRPVVLLSGGFLGWAVSFSLLAVIASGARIDVVAGFLAMVVSYTFGEILLSATARALSVRTAPDHARGRYLGLYQMSWTLSTIVTPATLMTLSGVQPALPWLVLTLAVAMTAVPLRNLRHIKAAVPD